MKNYFYAIVALAVLLAISFTSCDKEESISIEPYVQIDIPGKAKSQAKSAGVDFEHKLEIQTTSGEKLSVFVKGSIGDDDLYSSFSISQNILDSGILSESDLQGLLVMDAESAKSLSKLGGCNKGCKADFEKGTDNYKSCRSDCFWDGALKIGILVATVVLQL